MSVPAVFRAARVRAANFLSPDTLLSLGVAVPKTRPQQAHRPGPDQGRAGANDRSRQGVNAAHPLISPPSRFVHTIIPFPHAVH